MWKLKEARMGFIIGYCAVCLLLSLFPLTGFLAFPSGERFSELWILGPNNMAEDYPFNVKEGESYLVHVGVGNHMGSAAYYVVYLKFRNQTDPLPNTTLAAPSPLTPLYEYRVFVEDGKDWAAPLTFSIVDGSSYFNTSYVKSLRVNDYLFNINKTSVWDTENSGYYYQLLLELWLLDTETDAIRFSNRFVSLWLNFTAI